MKWNIGMKIGAGFGLALALLLIIGGVSYRGTLKLTETAGWVDHTNKVLVRLLELTHSLVDAETGQRGYLITGDDSYLQPYQSGIDAVDKKVQDIRDLTKDNPSQQGRLDSLDPLIKSRLEEMAEHIAIRRAKGFEAARAAVITGKGKATMDQIRSVIADMNSEEIKLLSVRTDEAAASTRSTIFTIVYGSVGAFLVLFLAGIAITRNISTPLREISAIAGRIAGGDLSVSVPISARKDEVGVLTSTFSQMTESLREMAGVAGEIASGNLQVNVEPQSDKDVLGTAFASMVANLRRLTSELAEGVNVLGASANEISTSTSQFASTATETAAAVSETTTTVEEVRQTAQVSSQKAKEVADSAQRVTQISQSGQKSTGEMVDGINRIREQMEAIAESMVRLSEQSQSIGQIVSTVEDIAAQSNLLAVNASIEAAKAGDHGKGFAVVALEVKSLADQSKQATSQVRAILNDIQKATGAAVMATEQGSKAVEAGVKQSALAGQSIETLAGSIAEAAQAATQIAASSQQQLVGVDQVASAMESIKLASTQNVEGAKQLETAAQDLKELGARLKHMVERYKV